MFSHLTQAKLAHALHQCLQRRIASRRPPDFIVGGKADPYLLRWYIIPRNPLCNIYLHKFLRSDDDRALHDHPWASVSVMLHGEYWEHTEKTDFNEHYRLDQTIRSATAYGVGDVVVRFSGKYAHRIEVNKPCWTLFITGPRYRNWGFHCPQGWVSWEKFTDPADKGGIGKGCDPQ